MSEASDLVEALGKIEQDFNNAVASSESQVEEVTDTRPRTPSVDGLQCLDTLAQLLEMLCTSNKENVAIRKRCSFLEENVRELQMVSVNLEITSVYM